MGIGNIPTQADMGRAIRNRGYVIDVNRGELFAVHAKTGRKVVAHGIQDYAAAIRYLYNAIVGDSAPQGGM